MKLFVETIRWCNASCCPLFVSPDSVFKQSDLSLFLLPQHIKIMFFNHYLINYTVSLSYYWMKWDWMKIITTSVVRFSRFIISWLPPSFFGERWGKRNISFHILYWIMLTDACWFCDELSSSSWTAGGKCFLFNWVTLDCSLIEQLTKNFHHFVMQHPFQIVYFRYTVSDSIFQIYCFR